MKARLAAAMNKSKPEMDQRLDHRSTGEPLHVRNPGEEYIIITAPTPLLSQLAHLKYSPLLYIKNLLLNLNQAMKFEFYKVTTPKRR